MYPAWAGVIVVGGLAIILFGLLYLLLRLNRKWAEESNSRIQESLKKRKLANDAFRRNYGYSWDIVIAFKVYDEDEELNEDQMKYSMKYVLQQLQAGGVEFRMFYSGQRKEVFCKIRASPSRLLREADRIDMTLLLDEKELKKYCQTGTEKWKPLEIPENSVQTSLAPYKYIYAKVLYDEATDGIRPDIANLYQKYQIYVYRNDLSDDTFSVQSPLRKNGTHKSSGNSQPDVQESNFRGIDRLKLLHSIITSKAESCCGIDIDKLVKSHAVQAYFPLHDVVELKTLENKWILMFQAPWNQEVDMIKNYFGEKIGLYFVWLGYYTTFLVPAAVFGFLTWAFIASESNNPNNAVVPYFAGFIALWSSLFLEFWKRTEKTYAMRWGMVGYENSEQIRPQFHGVPARSPVNGKIYLYYSQFERLKNSFRSGFAVGGFLLIVLATITIIFILRVIMNSADLSIGGQSVSGVVSSILFALQIQFFNVLYADFALKLNEMENHRTDTEYEDALISKTFMFQYVNSYASLFYIGFIKPFIPTVDSCQADNCMLELQVTLGTIFLTRLTIGNFSEVVMPLLMSYWKTYEREQSIKVSKKNDAKLGYLDDVPNQTDESDMTDIEKTFLLPEYDVMLGSFDDYAEMVIQFGYSTMFVSAFPLATVMSFVNNYVEIRVDGWKLCHLTKRPEPRSCEDIGTWYLIMEMISLSAVFINSALVAFTGSQTINYAWVERVWIFFLMSAGLVGIRLLVAYLVPDIPAEVDIQLQRQDYIVGKVLHNYKDEDEDANVYVKCPAVYAVLPTDDDPL